MRTLAQTNQISSNESIGKGQNIHEVYSEITEILKLERGRDASLDGLAVGDVRVDIKGEMMLIKKYIRAIHNTAEALGWKKEDDRVKKTLSLQKQYEGLHKEEIKSFPTIIDDRNHQVLIIANDASTRMIVPDELYVVSLESMRDAVLLRWLSRLSKIACQLADILATEVDLHKDYTDSKMTPARLASRYITPGGD